LGAVTLLARLLQESVVPKLSDLGLTFAQAVAMVRLWQAPTGELSQSVLIEMLAVSRASGSLVLSELESQGFIVRSVDRGDGRRHVVRLTDRGVAIEQAVHDVFEHAEAKLFDPVGSLEWQTTYRSLRSAIESLIEERSSSGGSHSTETPMRPGSGAVEAFGPGTST
jgi:DNA-binding MarR family transcriptional regulator